MCEIVCTKYRKQLWEYAEGGLSAGGMAEMEKHLSICPECRAELSLFIEVDDALETYPLSSTPSDLLGSILTEAHQFPQRHLKFVISLMEIVLAATLATATSILVWVALVSSLASEEQELTWMEDALDAIFGLTIEETVQLASQVLPWSALAVGCTLTLYLIAGIYNRRLTVR